MYIFLILEKAKESEKQPRARKLAYIFHHEKKIKKNDGLKSGVREWREKSGEKKGKNKRVWGSSRSLVIHKIFEQNFYQYK